MIISRVNVNLNVKFKIFSFYLLRTFLTSICIKNSDRTTLSFSFYLYLCMI